MTTGGPPGRFTIPLLGVGVVLPCVCGRFPFAWCRILDKGALLLMELAQDTEDSTLVYDATALPPPTSVTRSFPPTAGVVHGSR